MEIADSDDVHPGNSIRKSLQRGFAFEMHGTLITPYTEIVKRGGGGQEKGTRSKRAGHAELIPAAQRQPGLA